MHIRFAQFSDCCYLIEFSASCALDGRHEASPHSLAPITNFFKPAIKRLSLESSLSTACVEFVHRVELFYASPWIEFVLIFGAIELLLGFLVFSEIRGRFADLAFSRMLVVFVEGNVR